VVATWYDSYPAQLGFAGNGPITDGMTQYYGGWYRTADTPMLLIEHCIGADGGGIRADRPSPEAAARADFAALAKHFHLGDAPPPAQQYLVDGKDVGAGIHQLYTSAAEDTAARLRIFGLCVAGQHDAFLVTSPTDAQRAKGLSAVAHSVVAVTFERVTAIWDRGRTPAPFDCRIPMRTEQVGQPDEPYIQAILHSMELVGEKP
jgi:hypothetical protein